jgi:hypothetical protein
MAESSRPVIWSSDALESTSLKSGAIILTLPVKSSPTRLSVKSQKQAGYWKITRSPDGLETKFGAVRSIAAWPHVIFYRITGNRTEIVRVLDGRRDLDEIFAPSVKE